MTDDKLFARAWLRAHLYVYEGGCVSARARACVRACVVCVRVRACACVCVRACIHVSFIYLFTATLHHSHIKSHLNVCIYL